ncbi:f-box domain contaning protein [Gigaspora margarita]|uniref:F-box domain contaning protein n=1 Tax=Gigaspora margarita TaxID=4874 RepID=A0A8H3WVT1_GIGMA|nr:f-box domain contaning protein [Gigaspora margarita]
MKKTKSNVSTIDSEIFSNPFLLTVPLELFIKICKDLTSKDLLSLSLTCKTLHHDLLCDSKLIQEIWCSARLNYIPCRKLPPLRGMSEKAYIKLLIEDKCLFCGRTRCQSKIFWPRGIRCCGPCLKVHAIEHNQLGETYYRTNIIIQLIPFATSNKHQDHQYYFRDQIMELEQEIKNVRLEDYEIWRERNKVADRRKIIEEKLDAMCQEIDENGNVKFHREIINQCKSFNNSLNISRPFTERCWKRLRHNLEVEYDLQIKEND